MAGSLDFLKLAEDVRDVQRSLLSEYSRASGQRFENVNSDIFAFSKKHDRVLMRTTSVVYLIDDDIGFAKELKKLLSSIDIDVIPLESANQLSSGTEIHHPRIQHPGCVVADLGKPHLGVAQLLDELADSRLSLPLIALADEESLSSIVRAARDGAVAVLQKGQFSPDELLEAIQKALVIDQRRFGEKRQQEEFKRRQVSLNRSEQRVLELLLSGNEVLSIAAQLKVSRKTVEKHRASLMAKLDVQSFPELIALFARFGPPPRK